MRLTFNEIGVDIAEYNGCTFEHARSLIINKACDYIMDNVIKHTSEEHNAIPHPTTAVVCLYKHTVDIFVNMLHH